MILLDANQTMISNVFAIYGKKTDDLTINDVRHSLLKGIMYFNNKFREYGDMVLCYDSHNYWRTSLFPHYKAARKTKQGSSNIQWGKIYKFFDIVKREVDENFPYISMEVPSMEADDLIYAIVSEHHDDEEIMIVSSDKDFQQLQSYGGVHQYSPAHKDMLVCDDPDSYLVEHIIKGDSSDGIPNVLSDSDTFVVDGKKQKIMNSKRFNTILSRVKDDTILDSEFGTNFQRNRDLIDLSSISSENKEAIINKFRTEVSSRKEWKDDGKIMDYLTSNRLMSILKEMDQFHNKIDA
tara:strand:+ start:6940 stop:7821 length:882 start_codon:yes stop_codon:yes gene_type:complete